MEDGMGTESTHDDICPRMEVDVVEEKTIADEIEEDDEDIDMDVFWKVDEAFFLTKHYVSLEYHQVVAVWSCDRSYGASDVIPLIAKYSRVADICDKWRKHFKEWVGLLAFYHSVNEAYNASTLVPNLKLNGNWPLRALNVGRFLQFVSDTEYNLEQELRNLPTMISIANLPTSTSVEAVRDLCESFGHVSNIETVDERQRLFTRRYLISYTRSSDAYAAHTMLDCRKEFDSKMEVKVVESRKTISIAKEASRKDMLLWNRH